MLSEEKKAYDKKTAQVKIIIKMHKEGKSTRQIASKLWIAEQYVIDIARKGESAAISEVKKMFGINDDNVNSSGMIPSTREYLCECGTVMIDGKIEMGENDYIFRTLFCKKCNKKYYNPIDVKKYLNG